MVYVAKNKSLIGILSLLAISTSCAYSQVVSGDSILTATELNEFVVTSSEAIKIGNKTIYTPNRRLREATGSAVPLLAGLQIPEIIVNPTTGNITIMGGGKLSIRINGRPASERDLATVPSRDITKVAYLYNPGVRYGNAAGVLDISVRRPEKSGYSVFANILQSPNRSWGDYTAALKYNVGKSEWSVDYHSNPMWDIECYRDNDETIKLPDKSIIQRTESGIRTPNRMITHRATAQYSYASGRDMLFNAQTRLFRTDNIYRTTGNIFTISPAGEYLSMETEINPLESWQGDLDLYFHKRLDRRNSVYFNLIPTVINSRSARQYSTADTKIESQTRSRGYRIFAEGLWEGKIGNGTITTGIRSLSSKTRLTYNPGNEIIHENHSINTLFAEWKRSSEMWFYSFGMSMNYYCLSSPVGTRQFNFEPRLNIKYRPDNRLSIGLSGDCKTVNPSTGDLNPVLQRIDGYQSYRGNLSLRPFAIYNGCLELEGMVSGVSGKISISDTWAINPIMTAKSYEGTAIIQQPFNHGSNNRFEIKANMRAPLFHNLITVTMEGGWLSFISRGVNYKHHYSQPFINAQLMLIKESWWVMLKYNNSFNRLWGERIESENQNLTNIGIGYTYRNATFMGGLVNPFGNIAIKSRDLSDIAGYDRTYQASGSNRLVWIGITLNLRHGKNRAASKKKLDNATQYKSINNINK